MSEPVPATPLIPEQRQLKLLELLRRDGVVSTRNLTGYLGVSHMTVRRDIASLEAEGKVVSVQGGVRIAGTSSERVPTERTRRQVLEQPRKRAIAQRGAELVTDDMVVFIDAGTTCQAVVPHLAGRRELTVVTNDFFVVQDLFALAQASSGTEIQVIHTGGAVDFESGSTTGLLAAAMLRSLNIDVQLMSTGYWSIEKGVTARSTDQVELKRAVMDASTTSVLLADSSKYGGSARFGVTALDRLDVVVTDDGLSLQTVGGIEELGVEVAVAGMVAGGVDAVLAGVVAGGVVGAEAAG